MTEPDRRPGEATFGLVMPFVVCASAGGPYDDAAYVAGYEAASIDAELRASSDDGDLTRRFTVHPGNLPQLELIGMANGYPVMTQEPWADFPDEWTFVTFYPAFEEAAP